MGRGIKPSAPYYGSILLGLCEQFNSNANSRGDSDRQAPGGITACLTLILENGGGDGIWFRQRKDGTRDEHQADHLMAREVARRPKGTWQLKAS